MSLSFHAFDCLSQATFTNLCYLIKKAHSQKNLECLEIVFEKKFAIKCYEAVLYTSMNCDLDEKEKNKN